MEFIIMDAALFDLLLKKLNSLLDKANKIHNGKDATSETWLDGHEVCEILGINPRTLQPLRDTGKIAYTMIVHKIYYRPNDVQTILNKNIKK